MADDAKKAPEVSNRMVTRKRKSEVEKDPDFQPVASTSKKTPAKEKKVVVRRSKKSTETPPEPSKITFIERPEYSMDDSKKKARERKTRVKKTLAMAANSLKDVDPSSLARVNPNTLESMERFGAQHGNISIKEEVEDDAYDEEGLFTLDKLPKFVMGTGKGTPGGPPQFEFKSLWNYDLSQLKSDPSEDDRKSHFPWEDDPSVPDVEPTILSVVGGFSVGVELDLRSIAENSTNVQFNPDRYAPLVMRIREPRATGSIFRTGRVIVSGTQSEKDCYIAARKFARIIQKHGYSSVSVVGFGIQNVLASADVGFRVRLNQMYRNKMFGNLCYEPELFPGIVLPVRNPQVKVIVFCTGSVLMTGAKAEADVKEGFKIAYPLIRMYGH